MGNSIICRSCSKKARKEVRKHPCLFQPRDVLGATVRADGERVSTCRECRKEVRKAYQVFSGRPRGESWKPSMRELFAREVRA